LRVLSGPYKTVICHTVIDWWGHEFFIHFFVIFLQKNLVVSDYFCTFASVYKKSSGDGKLGQLRRQTAAVETAKTAN
jgi:hypothetical protein